MVHQMRVYAAYELKLIIIHASIDQVVTLINPRTFPSPVVEAVQFLLHCHSRSRFHFPRPFHAYMAFSNASYLAINTNIYLLSFYQSP